jgi:MoxR-like ATPase
MTLRDEFREEVAKVVIGNEDAVDLLLVASIAGGHVLLEGPPGVAKTLLAGAIARALGVKFTRIQFTPDTTPSELTGGEAVKLGERVFVPGAIFTNVLLADEINRSPPRTQAALLEAMQERHVTVDGRMHWLPSPFLVIATQNPYEHEGVFQLPASQLDRFLFKIVLGYPTEDDELRMTSLPHRGITPDMIEDVHPLLGPVELEQMQRELDETEIPAGVRKYVVGVVRRTRQVPGVALGASPRAAIHLVAAAKANAWIAGRPAVTIEDVARIAPFVLAHRLIVDDGDSHGAVLTALELPAALPG